jgi:hypothetical protein
LERDGKVLIDLVDGLSSEAVVVVSVMNGYLTDHDARFGAGAVERLPGHGDQAQAIVTTLFIVIGMLLGSGSLGDDQTLSRHTIDEAGLQWVCNHRVQASVLADTKHREQDVSKMILAASD